LKHCSLSQFYIQIGSNIQLRVFELCGITFIVFGTPVYWHTVSGSLKVLLERLSQGSSVLAGKRLVFCYQGSGPTPESVAQMEYMMGRFAEVMGMQLVGIASDAASVRRVNARLRSTA